MGPAAAAAVADRAGVRRGWQKNQSSEQRIMSEQAMELTRAAQAPQAVWASGRMSAEEDAARLERAMEYCRAHFRTAGLNDVAAHMGLSPFHFHRWFSRVAG